MLKKYVSVAAAAAIVWLSGQAAADPSRELTERLNSLVPGQQPDSVKASPLAGLHEVVYGPQVLYVSDDGRYAVQGDIVDLDTRTNLTEQKRSGARMDAINRLGEDSMIVFAPKKVKHTVSVFTDIDCGYCRKLHREMSTYNEAGIKVRYLAFPRAGVASPGYGKTVSVWCAEDRRKAMTDAKNGKAVSAKKCENPVREHFQMGRLVGITGTPTLVLETGDVIPGYVPAARLEEALEQAKREALASR